jgi:hypothetical protein
MIRTDRVWKFLHFLYYLDADTFIAGAPCVLPVPHHLIHSQNRPPFPARIPASPNIGLVERNIMCTRRLCPRYAPSGTTDEGVGSLADMDMAEVEVVNNKSSHEYYCGSAVGEFPI